MLLQDAFERKKISKNAVIRETNIDRSTFYQIIRGKRAATSEQFQKIISKLNLSSEERFQLCSAYEREKSGEKVFASRAAVKQFITNMSHGTSSEQKPADAQNAVADLIRNVSKSENPEIGFYVSADVISAFGIYGLLSAMAERTDHQIHATINLVIQDIESGTDDILLQNLLACLMALQTDHLKLDLYTIYGTKPAPAGQPFPYYCISCETVVLINADGTVCRKLMDPVFLEDYQSGFARAMEQASPAFTVARSQQELMQEVMRYLRACEGEKVFLMSPYPCILLSTTDEEIERYDLGENFLSYKHMLSSADIIEIGCRSGIERLLHSGRIEECGIVVPLRKEDVDVLRRHIQERIGRNLFLVNEEIVDIPSNWSIFVFGRDRVAFIPSGNASNLMVTACNRRITGLFYDWFQSRVQTYNADLLDAENEGARA